jgi:hypothetical protein
MSNDINSENGPGQPPVYEIRIKGHLGQEWTDWFGGLVITLEDNGDTRLTGPVVDQAALHGLLRKVRDVGMPLVSVAPIQQDDHRHPPMTSEGGTSNSCRPPFVLLLIFPRRLPVAPMATLTAQLKTILRVPG